MLDISILPMVYKTTFTSTVWVYGRYRKQWEHTPMANITIILIRSSVSGSFCGVVAFRDEVATSISPLDTRPGKRLHNYGKSPCY